MLPFPRVSRRTGIQCLTLNPPSRSNSPVQLFLIVTDVTIFNRKIFDRIEKAFNYAIAKDIFYFINTKRTGSNCICFKVIDI